MIQGTRRDRSRSPLKVDSVGRRRDKNQDGNKTADIPVNNMTNLPPNVMNPMMVANMYQQGNMMMGGMYPNMMMQGMMGGGMMATPTMEMIPSTAMEIMPQQGMEISTIAAPNLPAAPAAPMEMNMMGGMMMDPSMMGMYPGMPNPMSPMPEKKEIILKHCKLIPPATGTPQPPRRVKPSGCRTIFVGGLPDKIRESTVREIFETFGRIHTLRLSKKNFCHIRFDREECVDAAMTISGYRIKLTSGKDKDEMDEDENSHSMSGWLHVDYALSRDDQNEFERRQRQVLRVQQQQMQQMTAQQEMANHNAVPYRRSPSPVRIQPFSNAAIVQLAEKIKSEEHFSNTLPTLLAWLERGECSKKNANHFYTMIQATNSHIRRLFNDKMQSEEELQTCKERVKTHIGGIIEQRHVVSKRQDLLTRDPYYLATLVHGSFINEDTKSYVTRYRAGDDRSRYYDVEQVAKVFVAAAHQRVWDHFTKPQRKNIETWQKMTQEFNALKEEFHEKFDNDDDFNGFNRDSNEEIQQLKRENESLQFQLEAYKNEVDVIKADALKEMEKFKAQFIARQALQGAMDGKHPPLPSPIVKPPPPPPLPEDLDTNVTVKDTIESGCGEAKLIGVMSAFLQVHPQGASLDYVVSYVRALFGNVSQATIHHVLQRHPDVFRRTTSGIGANIEHRWSFVAFQKQDLS